MPMADWEHTSHQHPLAPGPGGCCSQHLAAHSPWGGSTHGEPQLELWECWGGARQNKGQFSVVISISPSLKKFVSSVIPFPLPSKGGAELPNKMRKLWQAVFACMEICRASGGPSPEESSEETDSPFLGC